MNKLHKSPVNKGLHFDSKEGRRGLLCNNSSPLRRPSLDLEDLSNSHLDVLADIIFEQFLLEHNKQDTL